MKGCAIFKIWGSRQRMSSLLSFRKRVAWLLEYPRFTFNGKNPVNSKPVLHVDTCPLPATKRTNEPTNYTNLLGKQANKSTASPLTQKKHGTAKHSTAVRQHFTQLVGTTAIQKTNPNKRDKTEYNKANNRKHNKLRCGHHRARATVLVTVGAVWADPDSEMAGSVVPLLARPCFDVRHMNRAYWTLVKRIWECGAPGNNGYQINIINIKKHQKHGLNLVEGLALCPSPTGVPIAGHPFRLGESPRAIGLQLLGVLVVSCTSLARLLALRHARSWKCPRAQERSCWNSNMCPAGHNANHGATHHLQNDKHRQLHHYKKGIFNFKISHWRILHIESTRSGI